MFFVEIGKNPCSKIHFVFLRLVQLSLTDSTCFGLHTVWTDCCFYGTWLIFYFFMLAHQRFKNIWKQLNNLNFVIFVEIGKNLCSKIVFVFLHLIKVESHRLHWLRIAHSLDGLLLLRNMVAIIFLMLAHQRLKNKRKQQNNFKFCYFCWNRK